MALCKKLFHYIIKFEQKRRKKYMTQTILIGCTNLGRECAFNFDWLILGIIEETVSTM